MLHATSVRRRNRPDRRYFRESWPDATSRCTAAAMGAPPNACLPRCFVSGSCSDRALSNQILQPLSIEGYGTSLSRIHPLVQKHKDHWIRQQMCQGAVWKFQGDLHRFPGYTYSFDAILSTSVTLVELTGCFFNSTWLPTPTPQPSSGGTSILARDTTASSPSRPPSSPFTTPSGSHDIGHSHSELACLGLECLRIQVASSTIGCSGFTACWVIAS